MIANCYEFSTDWFSRNEDLWLEHLGSLAHLKQPSVLEIGAWEGRSATWLADNILVGTGAKINCIDTWKSSCIESRFDRNTQKCALSSKCSFTKMKGDSRNVLLQLNRNLFDFIYIDGEHYSPTVLIELIYAFQHITINGFVAVDDYDLDKTRPLGHYTLEEVPEAQELPPSLAIDAFKSIFRNEIEEVYSGHQYIFKKRAI